MPIQVKCPNGYCGQIVTVRDEDAGNTARCPACGGLMAIPRLGPTSPIRTAPAPYSPAPGAPDVPPFTAAPPPDQPRPTGPGLWAIIDQLGREHGLDALSRNLLAAGIVALGLLAFSTILPWVVVHETHLGISLPSGILVFVMSVAAGVFVGVAFALKKRELFSASLFAAAGWGLVAFLWTLSLTVFQYGTASGAGLYLGFLVALGVSGVFGYLAYRRL